MSGKSQRGGRGGGRGGSSSGGRGGGSPKSPQNAAKELRLTGLVRSVVSGDSVVIMEINDKTKTASAPTEFQLTLIGLKAPALGKRFMKDGQAVRVDDEPFAWDSRENLRKQLIGKVVVYRVEHELEFDSGALKRKFGEIWLDGKNIRFSIVEQGWAKANIRERKPKDGKPAPPPSKEEQDIQAAEAKAKAAKIGLWSDNTRNAVRKVKDRDDPSKPEEQFAFFEKFKGKPLPAVVEHVKSGSSYRIYLVETQDELTISLSGARSPIYKPKDPANSEEFGLEAKLYAEHVLLNRSVSVVLDGAEKFSFFATVTLGDPTFETSNFAIDLLQRGLAHYAKWSLSKKADTLLYEKAENKARDAKLKVHTVKKPNQQVVGQGGKPQKVVDQPAPPQKSVTGTVVEIVSAGSLIVRTSKGNQSNDQKFLISSIKVPQLPANKKDKKKKDEGKKSDESSEDEVDAIEKKQAEEKKQASFAAEQLKKAQEVTGKKTGNQKKNAPIIDPVEQKKAEGAWALEAKEFLRKTLIGKQVQCVWDYSVKGKGKGKQEGEVRDFYSVYLGNQSVGLLLVEQGYAWVMAHAENQSRAPEWKDMALAEKAAIAKNLRLHGVLAGFLHTAPVNRLLVNDLSENENYRMKGFQKQREQKEAKDAAKGGKKEEVKKVKGDAQKNRSFAEELKKAGRLPAIVEYVVSAGRFKLSLPTKGYLLTLGLSAIRCDAKVKVGDVQDSNIQRSYPVVEKDGKTPIYPNIAFHFARNALLQRDVQVEVEGTDAGGGFVGRLWLQVGNDLIDWSYQLLKEGHAALSGFADRVITDNNVKTQYETAEKNAQDKKLNRWHNFDSEEHEAKKKEHRESKNKGAEDEGDDDKPASFERVLITEIMSGSNFFYQSANPDTESALKDLESAFATGNFDNEPAYAPERREKDKEKEMVAGKFTVDGAWYRAHVLRWITKGDVPEYEVRYIDYGNTEIVTKDNIRKLPDLLAKINGGKGLAQKARLAFITAPELDDDFGRDAAALFKELVWGKTMKASIRKGGRDQDVKNVSLGDEESLHISEELVKEGLARVNRKGPQSKNPEKPTEYQVLKATEAEAIKAHLNMWEYGELPDSEDERYHLNQLTR